MNDFAVKNQPNNYTTTNTNDPTTVKSGTQTTGSGNVNSTGPVPPTSSQFTYSVVLASIATYMPNMSGDNISVLISEIAEKLKEIQQLSDNEKYTLEANEKRATLAEKREKLEESVEKLKKAAEEKASGNIFAAIKAFFEMLGAAIMAVIGALTAVIPGLQVLGGLMIATAVLMAMMALDGIVKAANDGHGIVGSIMMAGGADPQEAAKGDMIFSGVVGGLALVGAIASLAVGNVSAIKAIVQEMMSFAKQVAEIAANAVSIATSLIDFGSAGLNMAAAVSSADGKKLQAAAKQLEALMTALDDIIDAAIARMKQAGDRFNDILDSSVDAINDRSRSLTQAKFSG